MAESDFLVPKPIQDGADLSNEWTRFKEEFDLYLTASEKDDKGDKIKVALMLRCIGPRGVDIFKSFQFADGKSKDVLADVVDKFRQFCVKSSNKIVKRHLLLSTKQGCMSVDEYITTLHKIARECRLDTMYDDFLLQALLLGINDEGVRKKLLEEDELQLERAIRKCRIAEAAISDLKAIKAEVDESVHTLKLRGKAGKPNKSRQSTESSETKPKSKCGNCGMSHPPRQCPAYGQQCHGCGKYNHYKKLCRSAKQIHQIAEDSGDDSEESLLCIQVIRSNKKLLSTIRTSSQHKQVNLQYQLDTGASCNIFNYQDYCALGKPTLSNKRPDLQLFDGSKTKPLGQCRVQVADKPFNFYVVRTDNLSLLSGETCLELGLLTIKQEWVNLVSDAPTIDEMVSQYSNVFKGVGCLPGEYHIEIEETATPIKNHNRKVPVSMLADLKKKLDTLVENKLIKLVDHPTDWINNMVAVRKPNGKLRLCLDPSNLNKVIKRNHFPMPTLDDVLVELDGAKVFSLCDAKDGFLQVKLDEESSNLATFWTPYGKYKWLRMAFGLTSSSEEFQRRLSEALDGLKGVTVVADDILIYGKGTTTHEAMKDHNNNVEQLLIRAQQVNLKLNRDKCRFLVPEIPYIGHVITSKGVKPDPKKLNAIKDMAPPTDSDGVRRFLGHINYVSKFIPNCSAESEPLRRLINTSEKDFVWADDQDKAFRKLKQLLSDESTLKYYKVNEPVVVQADASTAGLGAVLIQDGRPICYASRSLTVSEQKYAPIELELLAIVYGMQKFDQYVFGNKDITVHTDHEPLEAILSKPLLKAPKRLQSMMLALQRYPMKVSYRPGPLQVTADMLSRSPVDEASAGVEEQQIFQIQAFLSDLNIFNPKQDLPVSGNTYDQLKTATKDDEELSKVAELIMTGWPFKKSDLPESAKDYHGFRDELAILDGVVYRGSRIVIPQSCRSDILKKLHTSHQGTAATLRRARGAVFWPRMTEDIRIQTEKCTTCALDAPLQQKESHQSHEIPNKPWSKVGMDILTYKEKNYLIIVDYLTDFFECEHLPNSASSDVVKTCKKTFARYGIPDVVQSDNGPQFTSSEFTKFGNEWGFQHTTSSPGHQQSNGKAEAAVKIIKRILRRSDDPYLALLEYRNTPTVDMTSSPVERMLGRATKSILPTGNHDSRSYTSTHQILREKMQKHLTSQQNYNKSAKDLGPLAIGSPVLLRDFTSAKNKWDKWIHGKVIEKMSDRSYAILNENTGNILRRNRVDIRTCQMELQPMSIQENTTPENASDNDVNNRDHDKPANTGSPLQPSTIGGPPEQPSDAIQLTTRSPRPARDRRLPTKYDDYLMY